MTRLCHAASFAPIAVVLHCEQILSIASKLDAPRILHLMMPYVATTPTVASIKGREYTSMFHDIDISSHNELKLMALHVLTATIKNLTSSQLLTFLPTLIPAILPHFGSAQVDMRKATVFILVEVYVIIGDTLYPYVKQLTVQQKKLLTVYIERQLRSKVIT